MYTSSHNSRSQLDIGHLAESYVLEKLLAQKKDVTFFRKRTKEIDFLIPNEKVAIEVKYRSQIESAVLRNILEFSRINGYQANIATLNDYKADGNAQYVPTMLY